MTTAATIDLSQYTEREIAVAACRAVVREHRNAMETIQECDRIIKEAELRKAAAIEKARLSVTRANAALKPIRQDLSAVTGSAQQEFEGIEAILGDMEKKVEAFVLAAAFLVQ